MRFDDVTSLAGRIGARIGRSWLFGEGTVSRRMTAWVRPNLWHEFLGAPKTLFSSAAGFVPFRADLGGTWLELNAGVSGQIDTRTSLFASVSYQTRFEGQSFAYDGKLGLRVNW